VDHIDLATELAPVHRADIALASPEDLPLRMSLHEGCRGGFHDLVGGNVIEPCAPETKIKAPAAAEQRQGPQAGKFSHRHQQRHIEARHVDRMNGRRTVSTGGRQLGLPRALRHLTESLPLLGGERPRLVVRRR
jgi:hypothetical protein